MVENPFVSVILPVYNRAESVGNAIRSVYAQTYGDWELLIVDDGSTDGTVAALTGFKGRVTVFRQANSGPYVARNLALQHAKGALIAFLDSDDLWLPERLARQVPLFADSKLGLVFGNSHIIVEKPGQTRRLKETYFDRFPPARGNATLELCKKNFIPQSSVLARKECFERLGGFKPLRMRALDYAKWLEISLCYDLDFIATPIMEYHVHANNFGRQSAQLVNAPVEVFKELAANAQDPRVKDALLALASGVEITATAARMVYALRRLSGLPWSAKFHVVRFVLGVVMDGARAPVRRATSRWTAR